MTVGFYEVLHQRFQLHADRHVLTTPDGVTLTYGELDARVSAMSSLLREHGVGRGERVMAVVTKSPDALCLDLACLGAGVVAVPVNPSLTERELAVLVEDASPRLLVCRPELEEPLLALSAPLAGVEVRTLDGEGSGSFLDGIDAVGSRGPEQVADEDVAVVLYTSGTTGRPKGVMLTHRNLAANAHALTAAWGFTRDDVLLHALPLFHVHGLFVACHCALLSGASMRFLRGFDVDEVLASLPQVTVMMGVPTFYSRLLGRDELDRSLCEGVRLFTCGSAPLSAESFKAFEERTGHAIVERYGMTETLITTSNPLDGPRLPGSAGLPVGDTELRLGEGGELEVRGSSVFAGYLGQPEVTASAFRSDGFFRTGDIAQIDDDGRVWLAGRIADLIITGGENVSPREVEEALEALEGVAEAAVVGLPDPDLGEAVTAAVVGEDTALTEEAIRIELKIVLAGYKVPRRVHLVDALPRNAMGKVDRAEIRRRLGKNN